MGREEADQRNLYFCTLSQLIGDDQRESEKQSKMRRGRSGRNQKEQLLAKGEKKTTNKAAWDQLSAAITTRLEGSRTWASTQPLAEREGV